MAKTDTDEQAKAEQAAAEKKKAEQAKAEQAAAEKSAIQVRTRPTDKGLARVMWRGGVRFTAEPATIALAALSPSALTAIEGEAKLQTRRVKG